jgi:glycerophosphoryl diester phosphodiesterase
VPPAPTIIGHRGAALRAPENTLAGLRAAAELGARWVEFDVQATRDGCPFLLHDARLERTTDGHGIAVDCDAADLAPLDAGAWFAPRFRGERVPQLEDALALVAALGLGAMIEIKAEPGAGARTMRAALGALRGRDWTDRVILSSFHEDALEAAAAEAPAIRRALIVKAVPGDWRARLARLGCHALHADQRTLDANAVAAVAAEVPLRAYTVNAPARARTLFGWGVGAVFTDCPDVLISALGDESAGPGESGSRGSNIG